MPGGGRGRQKKGFDSFIRKSKSGGSGHGNLRVKALMERTDCLCGKKGRQFLSEHKKWERGMTRKGEA